jgi:hypothetical protein
MIGITDSSWAPSVMTIALTSSPVWSPRQDGIDLVADGSVGGNVVTLDAGDDSNLDGLVAFGLEGVIRRKPLEHHVEIGVLRIGGRQVDRGLPNRIAADDRGLDVGLPTNIVVEIDTEDEQHAYKATRATR